MLMLLSQKDPSRWAPVERGAADCFPQTSSFTIHHPFYYTKVMLPVDYCSMMSSATDIAECNTKHWFRMDMNDIEYAAPWRLVREWVIVE